MTFFHGLLPHDQARGKLRRNDRQREITIPKLHLRLPPARIRRDIRVMRSHLDRAGENRLLSVFIENGFDTESAIKKELAFEI